jgi:hypothetical protein
MVGNNLKPRIFNETLLKKVVEPELAVQEIKSDMIVGTAGGFQSSFCSDLLITA